MCFTVLRIYGHTSYRDETGWRLCSAIGLNWRKGSMEGTTHWLKTQNMQSCQPNSLAIQGHWIWNLQMDKAAGWDPCLDTTASRNVVCKYLSTSWCRPCHLIASIWYSVLKFCRFSSDSPGNRTQVSLLKNPPMLGKLNTHFGFSFSQREARGPESLSLVCCAVLEEGQRG